MHPRIIHLLPLSALLLHSLSHATGAASDKTGTCAPAAITGRRAAGAALLQSNRRVSIKSKEAVALQHTSTVGLYALLEQQAESVADDGVAVIVPGLGSEERVWQVAQNLQWLRAQNVPFECWIYIYKSEEDFALDTADSRFESCQIIRHPGYWMSHILELPLNMTSKPWILHMMDGIEPQPNVNLPVILEVMAANGLGHAAPTFDTQKHPNDYVDKVYPIMGRHSDSKIGRFVDFIELHFDVFSRKYFACIQDNIDNDNFLGWGMDRVLPAVCGGAIGGSEIDAGRMGLLDQMEMVKRFHGSYDLEAADRAGTNYIQKYPNVPGPQFQSLGELAAPPEA